jgi:glycosyltransferase involved in cell wall biosynthesis
LNNDNRSIAFIVAPHDRDGGGMGRVKDNIILSPPSGWNGLIMRELITRSTGGRIHSVRLMAQACIEILRARMNGTLAFVHVNMGDRGSAVRKGFITVFSRVIGAPVFLHLHAVTMEEDIKRAPRILQPILILPFRVATCVIVLGERWRRWIRDDLRLSDVPVETLTNGVPVDLVDGRDHDSQRARPFTILFLGNLIERKGISDLIAALSNVSDAIAPWQATFAGHGDVERYRQMADDAGIGRQSHFTGWVDTATARQLVAGADLLVLPSYHEGLPLVILEALGLGTPVIATPVGVISETLTDGDDIILVTPGDRTALASAIVTLARDPGLRQSLSDRGLVTFRKQFSIDAFRTNLLAIWQRYR